MKKKISIVIPCYNEKENIHILVDRLMSVIDKDLKNYDYEIIFIDNKSSDGTRELLLDISSKNKKIKLIFNSKNFGHIKSPLHGRLEATGDAVITLAADLQDPPEIIPQFIQKWEDGNEIVLGIKNTDSEDTFIMRYIRRVYYKVANKLADIELHENHSQYSLCDKKVLKEIKKIGDPYPYFRGLLSEIGFNIGKINYKKKKRTYSKSKNNLYTLYDIGILGVISYSKIPLRLMIFFGSISSILFFFLGIFFIFYKILKWDQFQMGMAPLLVLMSFFFSLILLFIGILGEYIGLLISRFKEVPVVEERRVNFDE